MPSTMVKISPFSGRGKVKGNYEHCPKTEENPNPSGVVTKHSRRKMGHQYQDPPGLGAKISGPPGAGVGASGNDPGKGMCSSPSGQDRTTGQQGREAPPTIGQRKSHVIKVRLPRELEAKIAAIAKVLGISKTDVIRLAIACGLKGKVEVLTAATLEGKGGWQ